MTSFNLEKTGQKINETKRSIGMEKVQVENLTETKEQTLTAISELQGADISEEAKESAIGALNAKLEQVSEQGDKVSDELGEHLSELEDTKQEIQETIDSNQDQQKKLEQKKALLEKIGMGETMDKTLDILDNESNQLDNLLADTIEAMKEANEASMKAQML